MVEMTPERAKRGCLGFLTLVGGFGAGIFVGYNQAHSNDLAPVVSTGLLVAPAGLSGILGYKNGKDFGSDPQAIREVANLQLGKENSMARSIIDPEKLARYNASRATGAYTWGGAITTAVATAIGYGLAKYLSN